MRHIVMYSGGVGSWATAKRVVQQHGADDLVLLFTDTLAEDGDLYRFLIESAAEIYGITEISDLVRRCTEIPEIVSESDVQIRKQLLPSIAAEASRIMPGLIWIADGRTPWDVFRDKRFIGNSRLAQCSHELKQVVARKWIVKNYQPEECILYLGIDWTEEHRTKAPVKNWSPYPVHFPMCDEPYLDKKDMLDALNMVGIETPRLYKLGFSHNNCSGACVRAGQGHWAKVFEEFRAAYAYQESKEQEMREYLGKDVSIMKQTRKGIQHRLTLADLRQQIEQRSGDIDREDIGGCGCFVTDEVGE